MAASKTIVSYSFLGRVRMRHAILGAGAVGGLIGTVLSSLGEDVTVMVRPEKMASYPANLTLERPSGSLTAPVKAVASLTEPVDVLWISTKTYQLQTALESVQASPKCVVPLLNGTDHVAVLRAQFGGERVVPGTIAVEAERIAPGRFVQRSRIQLPVHSERTDFALGQAFVPGSVCADDVGIRDESWRDSG
jgi:ketopantoate reductase